MRQLLDEGLELGQLTILVGKNGSGKPTIIEGIALAYGLSPEGGSTGARHSTQVSESGLHRALQLYRGIGASRWGYFLRAEMTHEIGPAVGRSRARVRCGAGVVELAVVHCRSFIISGRWKAPVSSQRVVHPRGKGDMQVQQGLEGVAAGQGQVHGGGQLVELRDLGAQLVHGRDDQLGPVREPAVRHTVQKI